MNIYTVQYIIDSSGFILNNVVIWYKDLSKIRERLVTESVIKIQRERKISLEWESVWVCFPIYIQVAYVRKHVLMMWALDHNNFNVNTFGFCALSDIIPSLAYDIQVRYMVILFLGILFWYNFYPF